MEGIVIKSTGSWYYVAHRDKVISCRIKGTFRLKDIRATNPLAVGDHVSFDMLEDGTGVIAELADRKNYIIRKSTKLSKQYQILAANIDRGFLVASIKSPRTSSGFIDRFLVTAEAYNIPASIIFNKTDILDEFDVEMMEEFIKIYESLGYPCYRLSAFSSTDIAGFRKCLDKGVFLFAGHSGVGKSTLLNAIEPSLELKTEDISKIHKTGVHTTTYAEMHRISEEVFIIDTPGIREFGMFSFAPEEVSHYYPEMRQLFNKCRYDNCLHINEPECAVKDAVNKNEIHPSRYYNYLSIIENQDIFR